VKKELAALAVLYLVAHLLYLPPTLEDIDSINFALGVGDFDVAKHQPHPPGYPVFVALAKSSAAILQALGVRDPAPAALALLSALAGTALIPLLFVLFRRFGAGVHLAWWAMAVAVCSPLMWFTALRPLSDMTGLAVATATQLCLLTALGRQSRSSPDADQALSARWLVAGGALCGLTSGIRAQTVMLTAPLFLAVLVWPRTGLSIRGRLLAVAAALGGVVAWAIPLLAANGGLDGYLTALGSQAGEDFSGVVMLWTARETKVAAVALLNSFVWPWEQYRFGVAMVVLAAAGAARLLWRDWPALVLCAIAFVPYAIFHLLFHETATMRYAMPLVVPIAFLAATAAEAAGRRPLAVAGAIAVIVSLVVTVPAARAYSRDGSPAFRVFAELPFAIARNPPPAAVPAATSILRAVTPALGMHASLRRVEEWQGDRRGWKVLRAGHGREWLALVEHWRAEPDGRVVFAADPRRTDLALFDPHARTLDASERWTLNERPFIAGIRPGNADAYLMRPPGWMLDRGWAVTAEVAGVTAREGLGPAVQPSTAWVRTRESAADLVLGGRQVGGAAPARVTLTLSDRVLATWDITPGFFYRRLALPAGSLTGSGYLPLRVGASAADGSGSGVEVKLEQFDLQSGANVMFGYADGWYEPEYNPTTSLAWHWMSEKARVWVRPVGRDVTLIISGESPLKYFESAPDVRILAGAAEVGRFAPAADFSQQITVPAHALAASDGMLTVESSLWFTPAQRGESADQRHLALRVYSVEVK
jgi:hypothetical protein